MANPNSFEDIDVDESLVVLLTPMAKSGKIESM